MNPTSPEIAEIYRLVAIWGIGIIGTLITVIALIFNSKQSKLAASMERAVEKEEFDKRLAESEALRMRLHDENSKKLDTIAETTEKIASQAVELGRIDLRVEMLEKREAYMGKWKHEVVDPYLPNEIKNLERRVAILEEEMKAMRNNSR